MLPKPKENFNYYMEERESFMEYIMRVEEQFDARTAEGRDNKQVAMFVIDDFRHQLYNRHNSKVRDHIVNHISRAKGTSCTALDLAAVFNWFNHRIRVKVGLAVEELGKLPWWMRQNLIGDGWYEKG